MAGPKNSFRVAVPGRAEPGHPLADLRSSEEGGEGGILRRRGGHLHIPPLAGPGGEPVHRDARVPGVHPVPVELHRVAPLQRAPVRRQHRAGDRAGLAEQPEGRRRRSHRNPRGEQRLGRDADDAGPVTVIFTAGAPASCHWISREPGRAGTSGRSAVSTPSATAPGGGR